MPVRRSTDNDDAASCDPSTKDLQPNEWKAEAKERGAIHTCGYSHDQPSKESGLTSIAVPIDRWSTVAPSNKSKSDYRFNFTTLHSFLYFLCFLSIVSI